MIDNFLKTQTLPIDGKRVQLDTLYRAFRKGLYPSQLGEWTRERFAAELNARGYPVGTIDGRDGRQYAGNLTLLRPSTYVEMFGTLIAY